MNLHSQQLRVPLRVCLNGPDFSILVWDILKNFHRFMTDMFALYFLSPVQSQSRFNAVCFEYPVLVFDPSGDSRNLNSLQFAQILFVGLPGRHTRAD